MLQTGDAVVVRALNFYAFLLFLPILGPLVLEIIGFGLGYIGGTSTAGALTTLPPLINYTLFFLCVILGTMLFLSFNTALTPPLLALHLLAFLVGIFTILIAGWQAWIDCIGGAVFCDATLIFIYSFGFFVIIVLMFSALIVLFALWTYSQAHWKRTTLARSDEYTYREITGDDTAPEEMQKQTRATNEEDEAGSDEDMSDAADNKDSTNPDEANIPSNKRRGGDGTKKRK
jgi:hypothetical protein